MPTPNKAQEESIRLSIGGLAHEEWDGWSIESDLLIASDGFELELYTKDATRLPSVLAEGAPCSLTLGKDRVLTGQIDEFEHDISRQGISMRITGRDRAAQPRPRPGAVCKLSRARVRGRRCSRLPRPMVCGRGSSLTGV